VVAIGFLVLLGIVGLALSQKSRMVRAIAMRIPISWEEDLGDKLYEQVKQSSRMVETKNADLDFVRERLLPVVANSGFKFRFHVIEDKSINAFAIPGGHVFIHTGLLKAVGRPEELAGVLAHEIAHVTQRHAFRKLIESSGLYLVVQYFLGDATGIMAAIANSSELLLKQKYSRDFEREADDVGWNYLVQAKIDPRGMLDFFQKLKAEEAKLPAGSGPGWDLLSTHPSSEERIRRLKKLHPEFK
jgi:predicted Zn-dependent protease